MSDGRFRQEPEPKNGCTPKITNFEVIAIKTKDLTYKGNKQITEIELKINIGT